MAGKLDIAIDQGATWTATWYLGNDYIDLTSITKSGSVATATASVDHGFTTGDYVYIQGADQASYNGAVQVTSTGALTFTFANGATATTVVSGSPQASKLRDLTGYGARMQIRNQYDSANYLLSLTSGAGLTVTAAQGKIAASVTAASTAALDFNRSSWDLEIVSGAVVERVLYGTAVLNPEVTK